MLKATVQYKNFTIETHVGGVKPMYRAFDENGNKIIAGYNLAWLKKDIRDYITYEGKVFTDTCESSKLE